MTMTEQLAEGFTALDPEQNLHDFADQPRDEDTLFQLGRVEWFDEEIGEFLEVRV